MARDRTDSSPAGQLITRLNTLVAQLIGENRKLRREIERLSQRAAAAKKTKSVTRPVRRPVKKAVAAAKRLRKPATVKGRKTKTTTRRGRR